MDILILIILIVVVVLAMMQIRKRLFSALSPTTLKKSDIINGYKKHINTLNTKEEKLDYIKEINQELARNIFFDQDELKEAMKTLTEYSIK